MSELVTKLGCHPGRLKGDPGPIPTAVSSSLNSCLWIPALAALGRDDTRRRGAA